MRKPDALGFSLLAALLGLLVAASVAAVSFGWFKGWAEFALFVAVGFVCIAVRLPEGGQMQPRNSKVHGDARLANETEAQRAAQGAMKTPHLHDRQFSD